MRIPDYQNRRFKLWHQNSTDAEGVRVIRLRIRDRFSKPTHKANRFLFSSFVHQLERYLNRHPDMSFDYSHNRARSMIYILPGIRAWAAYMPGAFATYPVHNPDLKHMHTGRKIDYLTRNLFRHSYDAIGLRSRSYAMSWYVLNHVSNIRNRRVRWLSVAAGTGYPTFEAADLLKKYPSITLCDIDDEALGAARQLAVERRVSKNVTTVTSDITKRGAFAGLLKQNQPDVVDMMGLVEYLDDDTVMNLVKTFYKQAPKGSLMAFTNMRPTHPHLQVHKRGLGWPDVQVRRISDVLALLDTAGVSHENVDILAPDDQVYGIYCIKKP